MGRGPSETVSFCDPLRLQWYIDHNIEIPEGEHHSPIQEFARRMGQKSWQQPANIYDILNKRRKASYTWTKKAAEVLDTKLYNLLPRQILMEVVSGLFAELAENNAPESLLKEMKLGIFTNSEYAPFSRLFHDLYLVKDKSMEPSLLKGSTVRVATENLLDADEFDSGQPYFVEYQDGDFNMRLVYMEEGGDRFILQPLNHRFEVIILDRERIHRISRIF